MRFFEPTPAFIQWIRDHAGRRMVVDIGCGDGHVTLALQQAGLDCKGVDLPERLDPEVKAQLIPASTWEMDAVRLHDLLANPQTVPMFCRPCHGGFISSVVESASERRRPWVYVGLPENRDQDIGDWHYTLVLEKAGLEGESVWLFHPKAWVMSQTERADKWWLVKTRQGISWMIRHDRLGPGGKPCEVGGYWVNANGGGFNVRDEEVLDTRVAVDWLELPMEQTTSYQHLKDLQSDETVFEGWISPEGEFHRCGYFAHDQYVHVMLRKEVGEIEKLGWARVLLTGGTPFASCRGDMSLTRAQELKEEEILKAWEAQNG